MLTKRQDVEAKANWRYAFGWTLAEVRDAMSIDVIG